MVSPLCEVKDGAGAYVSTDNGVNVTPGNTITIHLIDTSASTWSISCIYTDDLSVAATVTAGLTVDPITRTATFTAPVAGRAYIFRSVVNNGVGPDGRTRASYSTTFGVYTLMSGMRVLAANETTEGNTTFGWTTVLNALIRNGLGGAVLDTTNSTLTQSAYECETSDATPYNPAGATVALAADTTTTVDVEARCIEAGAGVTKVFNLRRHFLNAAGVITASTQEVVSGPDEVGGTLAADVNINYTGTTARVDVTGVAATDLRWRVDLQATQLEAGVTALNVASIAPSSGTIAGGTAVTLTGTGFSTATGATVGGVALTSFTVVDDTTITGTTGAHAAGAVDVVVTRPTGSDTLVGGFTFSSAFDPSTKSLTGWWRAGSTWDDVAGEWTGTASAGSSGSRLLDDATTGFPTPADGAALNSLVGPDFNGTDDMLFGNPTVTTTYWGTGSGQVFVAALFNADTATADPGAGSRRNAPAIVAETNAYAGLYFHTGGVTFAIVTDDGGGTVYEITKACTTAAWHSAVAWWDGSNLHLEVDGVAATPVATTGSGIPSLADPLRVGRNYAAAYFDGRIYDLQTATSAVETSAEHISYVNNRYGLAL